MSVSPQRLPGAAAGTWRKPLWPGLGQAMGSTAVPWRPSCEEL